MRSGNLSSMRGGGCLIPWGQLSSPPSPSLTEGTQKGLLLFMVPICPIFVREPETASSQRLFSPPQPRDSQEQGHASPLAANIKPRVSILHSWSSWVSELGPRGTQALFLGLSLTLLWKLPLSNLGFAPGKGAHGLTTGPTFTKFQCAWLPGARDSYK